MVFIIGKKFWKHYAERFECSCYIFEIFVYAEKFKALSNGSITKNWQIAIQLDQLIAKTIVYISTSSFQTSWDEVRTEKHNLFIEDPAAQIQSPKTQSQT